MGLADAFACEDRVQLKVSDLMQIMKMEALNYAQNQCMIEGLKAHLPHNHILIMIGEGPTCVEEVGKYEYEDDPDLRQNGPVKAKRKLLNNNEEDK